MPHNERGKGHQAEIKPIVVSIRRHPSLAKGTDNIRDRVDMAADTAVNILCPRSGIRDNENLVGVNQIRITDNGTVFTVDIHITDTLP